MPSMSLCMRIRLPTCMSVGLRFPAIIAIFSSHRFPLLFRAFSLTLDSSRFVNCTPAALRPSWRCLHLEMVLTYPRCWEDGNETPRVHRGTWRRGGLLATRGARSGPDCADRISRHHGSFGHVTPDRKPAGRLTRSGLG